MGPHFVGTIYSTAAVNGLKNKPLPFFSMKYFPIFFFFLMKKSDLVRLWTLKNFSLDTLGVNFEVLKLLHLCIDCYEVCFK